MVSIKGSKIRKILTQGIIWIAPFLALLFFLYFSCFSVEFFKVLAYNPHVFEGFLGNLVLAIIALAIYVLLSYAAFFQQKTMRQKSTFLFAYFFFTLCVATIIAFQIINIEISFSLTSFEITEFLAILIAAPLAFYFAGYKRKTIFAKIKEMGFDKFLVAVLIAFIFLVSAIQVSRTIALSGTIVSQPSQFSFESGNSTLIQQVVSDSNGLSVSIHQINKGLYNEEIAKVESYRDKKLLLMPYFSQPNVKGNLSRLNSLIISINSTMGDNYIPINYNNGVLELNELRRQDFDSRLLIGGNVKVSVFLTCVPANNEVIHNLTVEIANFDEYCILNIYLA